LTGLRVAEDLAHVREIGRRLSRKRGSREGAERQRGDQPVETVHLSILQELVSAGLELYGFL